MLFVSIDAASFHSNGVMLQENKATSSSELFGRLKIKKNKRKTFQAIELNIARKLKWIQVLEWPAKGNIHISVRVFI